jgi:hypothetical protein
MRARHTPGLGSRILIIGLTTWGLGMIVPDLYRVVAPLDSAGFAADNDGRIYDVQGPFVQESESPAWSAGLRVGDRLDLAAMRCAPPRGAACASLLSVLGGMGGEQRVRRGRVLALTILPADGGPRRVVTVTAKPSPASWLTRLVLLLNESAGIAFVLAATWLAWRRPGAMTLGFWLYAIWFNPGQNFVYYLALQERPVLAFAQEVLSALAHGAACAGFLLFALRVPDDRSERQWRLIERILPTVGVAVAAMQLLSYANVLGYLTENIGRATFFADYGVDAFAVWILLRRRHGHPPQEYQRMRWIIWGCLIGLPAYILSGILQSTSLWHTLSGSETIPQDVVGILLLVYGILGWFVFEAISRPRVVNVSIPLRRITVFGVLLSVPTLFAHQETEHLRKVLHLQSWAWIAVASLVLFVLGRLHELSAHLADRVFNRAFRRHTGRLAEVSREILRTDSVETIEQLLIEAPLHQLGLASAAVFRHDDGAFRRHAECPGWSAEAAEALDPHDAAFAGVATGKPFPIDPADAERLGFPPGLAAPTVVVPVRDKLRNFAVALYGPHVSGADLADDERAMLAALAADAALAYRGAEASELREQVAALEQRLAGAGDTAESKSDA